MLRTDDVLDPMKRLRTEFIDASRASIGNAIDALAASADIDIADRLASLTALHAQLVSKLQELSSLNLPDKAPELWVERERKSENPAEFIRRVYARYQIKGAPRAVFRKLDRKLHKALTDWLRYNTMPDDLGLLSSSEVTDQRLATLLPDLNANPAVRDAERLRGAIRQRRHRAKRLVKG